MSEHAKRQRQSMSRPATPSKTVRRVPTKQAQAGASNQALQREWRDGALSPDLIARAAPALGNQGIQRLIQTKLTVGPPKDRYEREADHVADQVMRAPDPVAAPAVQRAGAEEEELQTKPLANAITPLVQRAGAEEEELQTKPLVQRAGAEEEELQTKPLIQRAGAEEEELQTKPLVQRAGAEEEELQTKPSLQRESADEGFAASSSLETRLDAQKGNGSPLPTDVRNFMEPRFGTDFGDVRIHTGGDASQMNREVQAQAFTLGHDIYLGEGKYNPGSADGKHLLAHELTHVVQQTGAAQRKPRGGTAVAEPPVESQVQPSRVQRLVEVNGAIIKDEKVAWANITAAHYQPAGGWTKKHKSRLKTWIKRKETYSAAKWYMTAQSWTFNDWEDAAEALDAHILSAPRRKQEGKLAGKARKSPKIRRDLGTALQRIGGWISQSYQGAITADTYGGNSKNYPGIWKYLEQFKGQYRHWYPNGNVRKRMLTPSTNRVATNFVILREVFYALSLVTDVGGNNPEQVRPTGARYGTGPQGPVRIDKGTGMETRREDFTPESQHNWVKQARVLNMPLGAGASNTTDGILFMAGKAGVDGAGKAAIAWAGFVFWNKRYYKTQGYGHTFHEVMDVAHQEHGVEYQPGAIPVQAPDDETDD